VAGVAVAVASWSSCCHWADYGCVPLLVQVGEALQQAGVRVKLNVVLDGPVVVDVALQQRQVGPWNPHHP
jgi:hypothetical protein